MDLLKSADHLVYQAAPASGHRGDIEEANVEIITELYEGIDKEVVSTVTVGDYATFRLQVQILRIYDFVIMMLI